MFILGDLPRLKAHDIDDVITAYRESNAPLATAVYNGNNAHPVIFRKDLWPELKEITGDIGGREVLKRHLSEAVTVELPEAACVTDIDTYEDYLRNGGGTNGE